MVFVGVPGTTEFVKRWEPQKGDIVSFKHRGYMFGTKKPKLPVLYRLRPELAWDDVKSNWKEKIPHVTGTLPFPLPPPPPTTLNTQSKKYSIASKEASGETSAKGILAG